MKNWTYEQLKEDGLIIYEVISGSRAYGTDLPTSDEDRRFVYVQPLDDILGLNYHPQVNDNTNDIVGWEIRRFMELLATANPAVIELLAIPDDCVVSKHPVFDHVLDNRDAFLTKKLKKSISGFAFQQIKKAKGQDKKMNWDKERAARKTPLDFCYIPNKQGSILVSDWLKLNGFVQSDIGLVSIPNMRGLYGVYTEGTNKGIINQDESSNDLRVSEIPVDAVPMTLLYYNQDGYSMHCREYREYQEWLEKRNMARWTDSDKHGQKIDGKNLLHTVRLMRMSFEIATGKGLIVRRPDREELLNIRRGIGVDLDALLDEAIKQLPIVEAHYDQSNLPEGVSDELRDELLRNIRNEFYQSLK